MASYITYKTIISKAITDFNAIQDALNTVGATYDNAGVSATGSTGAVLVPTGDVAPIITGQLQLRASGTLTSPTVASDGTVDLRISDYKSYRYVKLTLGTATTPATTITPNALTGAFANGKYTVSMAQKTQNVTPDVSAGYITKGTAGTITVSATSLDIPQLKSFKWSGKSLLANGNGYVVKDQLLATMDNATIAADAAKTISVSNGLTLVTADSTTVNGVNIYNNLLNVTADTSTNPNPSGFTNVTTTEPSSGKFLAFTATSTGGETTASTTVSKAGYAETKTYSTTVSTAGHTAVTYYYPVKEASATVTGSKQATTPTIANNTSATINGKTRISATLTTDSTAIDKYFLALNATAPATTGISLTPTIAATGYLGEKAQITGSASTTAHTSGNYFYAIPKATFGVSGNSITVASAGYIGTGDTVANVNAGSLTYTAGLTTTFVDVDKKTNNDVPAESLFFSTLTDAQKKKDYYKIVSTGHGTLTSGYIGTNPGAATKTLYMPKATLEYVTDSEKNKIINVKTAGFLPAGILHDVGEISGDLDIAVLDVALPTVPTFDSASNLYKLKASVSVTSAGYVDSNVTAEKEISIAKTTYTGGGLSGAATSSLSVTAGGNYTSSTGTKTVTVKADDHTITRAAVTVKSSGYDSANNSVLVSGTAKITGGSLVVHIKDGVIGENSSSCAITPNTTTAAANKGKAKVYATSEAAGANSFVTVAATSSSSCAVTTSGWIDAVTKTKTGSTIAYLAASVNPDVSYSSSVGTSNLAATQFTDNSTSKTVSITGGTNKTVTSSASATVPNVTDTYIVGTLGKTATSQGSGTINADCSGSNVDSAFQSLYNRMLGYQYTDVSPDA